MDPNDDIDRTYDHVADEDVREFRDELDGKPVTYRCKLVEPRDVTASMERAGFSIEELVLRRPYDDEYPSEGVYILATKPGNPGGSGGAVE